MEHVDRPSALEPFSHEIRRNWFDRLWNNRGQQGAPRAQYGMALLEEQALRQVIDYVAERARQKAVEETSLPMMRPTGDLPVRADLPFWTYDELGPGVHREALVGALVASLVEQGQVHRLIKRGQDVNHHACLAPIVLDLAFDAFISALRPGPGPTSYEVEFLKNATLLQRGVWRDRATLVDAGTELPWDPTRRALLRTLLISATNDTTTRFWLARTLALPRKVDVLRAVIAKDSSELNVLARTVALRLDEYGAHVKAIRNSQDVAWFEQNLKWRIVGACHHHDQSNDAGVRNDRIDEMCDRIQLDVLHGLRMIPPSPTGRLRRSGRYRASAYTYASPFPLWVGTIIDSHMLKGLKLEQALLGARDDTPEITATRCIMWRLVLEHAGQGQQDGRCPPEGTEYLPSWLWELWKKAGLEIQQRVSDGDLAQTIGDAVASKETLNRLKTRVTAREESWDDWKKGVRRRLADWLLASKRIDDARYDVQKSLNTRSISYEDIIERQGAAGVAEADEVRMALVDGLEGESDESNSATRDGAAAQRLEGINNLLYKIILAINARHDSDINVGELLKGMYGHELEGIARGWSVLSDRKILRAADFPWRWDPAHRAAIREPYTCALDQHTGIVRIRPTAHVDASAPERCPTCRIIANTPDIYQNRLRMWNRLRDDATLEALYHDWCEHLAVPDGARPFDRDCVKAFLCGKEWYSVLAVLRRMARGMVLEDSDSMDGDSPRGDSRPGRRGNVGMDDEPLGDVDGDDDLPTICAEVQQDYMDALIGEPRVGDLYPDQWAHIQNCRSCLSTYLGASRWAMVVADLYAPVPQRAPWHPLANIVAYRARLGRLHAYLGNIQGTVAGWATLDPTSIIKLERPTGMQGVGAGLRTSHDYAPRGDQGNETQGTMTLTSEGWQIQLALTGDEARPQLTVHLLSAPATGPVQVKLAEHEATLAGVGASCSLPLQEGNLEFATPPTNTQDGMRHDSESTVVESPVG